VDKLDHLHVVSDLHLGGVPGHQICNQGAALAEVIDHIGASHAEQRVGLVLNGDIVDFLAAEDAQHFDPTGAPRKLQAIFDDPNFEPVWSALARFVRLPHRVLVLVMGNHDVELGLPDVQGLLLARIAGDDPAARGRVRVAMDGTGYTCLIGGRRALCVHGNDADAWNIVDHDTLRDLVKAQNEGSAPPPWKPNAGTRLVVDVMNAIKRTYPFVDLLKPETVAVPGVLLALPEHFHPNLLDFARITARLALDGVRAETGFLSAAPPAAATPAEGYRALDRLVQAGGPDPRGAGTGQPSAPKAVEPGSSSLAWLRQAEQDFAAGRRPADVVGSQGEQMLGLVDIVLDRLAGRDPKEDLRKALAHYLAGDDTFLFDKQDATFRSLDADVGEHVFFLVAGHTHLERRIPRTRGGGVYFNSGTWIRLIRLSEAMLASPDHFAPVFRALSSGDIEALDRTPGLVVQPRTVVSMWVEGDEVHGELRNAVSCPRPAGFPQGAPPWIPVPGTRYTSSSLER
jgi:UDP-2,3-diacylglucosamine pyrophosphatase LpxH